MKALWIAVVASALWAQQSPQTQFVVASGDATVAAQPDQVKIDVGVVTQDKTAQAAATTNSTQTQAVLSALTPLVGSNGTIQTISYSVTPNYTYPSNSSPVLTGYTVNNVVEVTTSDLTSIGKLIDTAVGAGANNIQSLQFGLKDDQPVRSQALRQAAAQAKTQAEAIASGLGLHTTSVISAQESSATVAPVVRTAAGASASTPVQPGTVQVQASVTVTMAMQ